MTNRFYLRPYAAKAVIEHEFSVNLLFIWVIFKFPMDQTVKPDHADWVCKVDSVAKAVTVSAWQDEFTIMLTVPAIAAIPDKVTLEYEGPSSNLKTTWDKQWEPWGPILSTDSTLLPYGSFYGIDINWSQAAAQNTWYTISDVDIVAGPVHKTTFQNDQELKIAVAGFYLINYYAALECSLANKHLHTAIEVNGTEQNLGTTHLEFGRANEEFPISGTSIINLAVDDIVSIGIMTDDIGNPTIEVHNIGLTLIEIGTS